MKKSSLKNLIINDENQKPSKLKKQKKPIKPIVIENEYSDPSDLDISLDLEPDVAYGKLKSLSSITVDSKKTVLDEFKPLILTNLLDTESDFMPLDTELVMKNRHRIALVDWILRINAEFMFSDDTLYSAVDLFDRIYKSRKIKRCHYQLFAATSLWIASKLEETQTPALSDFIYLCDDVYNENEFIECEKAFCITLDYNMYAPTSRSYILAMTSDEDYNYLTPVAEWFLKIAIFAEDYAKTVPSHVAIACIYLAILATNSDMDCLEDCEEMCGLDIKEICNFAKEIIDTYHDINGGATSEEARSILLKGMSKLPLKMPYFDERFISKIKTSDLVTLL